MFVRKNLLQRSDIIRRNGFLKGLTLFFLGASAMLLFSSADLILNPYISNSYVYLQKLFLSPNGTLNTVATISFDGLSGTIVASGITTNALNTTNLNASVFTSAVASINTQINSLSFCELSGANCFSAAKIGSLSGDVALLSSNAVSLSGNVSSLSGKIQALEGLILALSGKIANLNLQSNP